MLVGIALTLAALWTATALGALVGRLPLGGSCYLGLVLLAVAMVYVGVGAVANQVLPTRRGALGAAAAVLGVDFVLRLVADTTDTFSLHWVSPLGWAEEMRAFSGSHALVVLLPLVTTVLLLSLAVVLHARRDLGRAYVAPHDTAPPRLGLLASPFRLALRLDRTAIATWALSIAVFAFVVGTVAKSVEDLDLPRELREQIEKIGGIDITRASGYVGLTFLIFVFAIGLFVCGQMSAVRDEESSHRLETLLSLPYGRTQWLGGRIALIIGAGVVTGVGAGLGAGLGVLVTGGDMTFAQGLEAGVNLLPAMVLFVGVGVVALGVRAARRRRTAVRVRRRHVRVGPVRRTAQLPRLAARRLPVPSHCAGTREVDRSGLGDCHARGGRGRRPRRGGPVRPPRPHRRLTG